MQTPTPATPQRVRPRKRGSARRRPRFSLWALMAVLTGAALFLGALVALPPSLLLMLGRFISLAAFMAALLGVIHGRGNVRTFFTGALVAAAYYLVPELLGPRSAADLMFAELAQSLLREQDRFTVTQEAAFAFVSLSGVFEILTAMAALGGFSVWFRKWIERRQRGRR